MLSKGGKIFGFFISLYGLSVIVPFCFRSKDLVQDFYLAPFACAEVGFLHLEQGDLDQAKEYLNKARYEVTLKILLGVTFRNFVETAG